MAAPGGEDAVGETVIGGEKAAADMRGALEVGGSGGPMWARVLMAMAGPEFRGRLRAASEAAWAEDGVGGEERDFESLEQLANGGFIGGDELGGFGGKLEVEIADGPADAGGGGRG